MTIQEQKNKCEKCEHSEILCSGNFSFIGCKFGELKGKWVAELICCPKESEKNNK